MVHDTIGLSSSSGNKNLLSRTNREFSSPYIIKPAPAFELVRLPDGQVKKLAYGRYFDRFMTDYEIELAFIQKFEFSSSHRQDILEYYTPEQLKYGKERLKFHYRRAIALSSPRMARGWNRWSEYILDLFLSNKLYRVLWGSGGSSKSSVLGLLRYTRWRVNPSQRMCVIASMVVKESKARVFGYITDFHKKAPASTQHKIEIYTGQTNKGIYVQTQDPTGKWINVENACIVALPIKVDADAETFGDNLIGLHPEDALDIDFDEAQEIPGNVTEMRVFFNWLSNPKVSVNAWGNPNPVTFFAKQDYDLLFRLGIGNMTEAQVREREFQLEKCDRWELEDTSALRLSTLDSPKDDPEEKDNFYFAFGQKKHRLEFLAGKNSVEQLKKDTPKHSVAYYSQIYGFPLIDYAGEWTKGVLSPKIVDEAQRYPWVWKSTQYERRWFMGVDSSPTGTGDACSIVCGQLGQMTDSRVAIDLAHGRYCLTLHKENNEEQFTDQVIREMQRLANELRIPLSNIGVETHSSGEVLKYALQKSLEAKGEDYKWWTRKGRFHTVSPVSAPTEREIFKELGKFFPAKDIVTDINTEYWLAVRCAVMTRQLFNIPDKIKDQYYNRILGMNTNNTKYKIETKKEMKKRGVPSPNDGDALANMLEVARVRGAFHFRFRTTGGYNAFFTPEREAMLEREEIRKKLGRVSGMLGMGLDMGVYSATGGARTGKESVGFAVGFGAFNSESV